MGAVTSGLRGGHVPFSTCGSSPNSHRQAGSCSAWHLRGGTSTG